jgi:hypothetical protein
MNSHGFFRGYFIDGFEYKAIILLIFGPAKDIIPEIIRFNLLFPLCKHKMLIHIEPKLFFLPSFDIEASGETDGIEHTCKLRFRWLELIIDKL